MKRKTKKLHNQTISARMFLTKRKKEKNDTKENITIRQKKKINKNEKIDDIFVTKIPCGKN